VLAAVLLLSACVGERPSFVEEGPGVEMTALVPIEVETEQLLDACMEYVPLAAFFGDVEMSAVMAAGTGQPGELSRFCETVVSTDRNRAREMSASLAEMSPPPTSPMPEDTTLPPSEDVTPPDSTDAPPVELVETTTTSLVPSMPAVVCMDLPSAQEDVEMSGGVVGRVFDASGQSRPQPVPTDWVVVSQFPKPGETFDGSGVLLGVIKFGEGSCR
jgi:hypothetical protein